MKVLASSEAETDELAWEISQAHSGPGMLPSVHQRRERKATWVFVCAFKFTSGPGRTNGVTQACRGVQPGYLGDTG